VKLDENIPVRLAETLRARGHDVHTVPQEGLAGRPDSEIWLAAQHERRFLVTQDMRFSDLRLYPPGRHWGVLVVRLRLPSRNALFHRLQSLFSTEHVEAWQGCIVVASDHKLRIRRPQ